MNAIINNEKGAKARVQRWDRTAQGAWRGNPPKKRRHGLAIRISLKRKRRDWFDGGKVGSERKRTGRTKCCRFRPSLPRSSFEGVRNLKGSRGKEETITVREDKPKGRARERPKFFGILDVQVPG